MQNQVIFDHFKTIPYKIEIYIDICKQTGSPNESVAM